MDAEERQQFLNTNEPYPEQSGETASPPNNEESVNEDPRTDSASPKWTFLGGPRVPVAPHVTMWFEPLQTYPCKLHRVLPRWFKWGVVVVTWLMWILSTYLFSVHGILAEPRWLDPDSNGNGYNNYVHELSCDLTHSVWKGANTACGMDGSKCLGTTNSTEPFAFKCPANCRYEGRTFQPFPVGDRVIMREQYIIGGEAASGLYRSDSFVCAAGTHAGIISNFRGGCGILRFRGPQPQFHGADQNGMHSFDFDASFPGSYTVERGKFSGCHDLRWPMIVVNLLFVLAFAFFCESPAVMLFSVVVIGFWTVILGSNPPWVGGSPELNAEIISLGFRRLLPCMLGTYVVYQLATKPQLTGMRAHLSRTIFWAGAFWCGILENYVFGMIPIDRLTVSDLNSQAGAWFALFIVVSIVVFIVVSQAYIIWRAGKLRKYLGWYGLGVLCVVILAAWPQETLRIHHYIMALFFLPGTGFQTTPSLVYQGLLTGLYVAGVARWDFDSILQTGEQLRRGGPVSRTGDAIFEEPSTVGAGIANGLAQVVLNWAAPGRSSLYDGFSLIINDVERYRGFDTAFNLTHWAISTFSPEIPLKYYVRVAVAAVHGSATGSFTRAATVYLDSGNWTAPEEGRT